MKMHFFLRVCLRRALVRSVFLAVAACWLTALSGNGSKAAEVLQVVCVEEEWELVVATPDLNRTAPQVTCAFSPVSEMESLYTTFELNHQSQPEFVPGGMQLQVWRGEELLASRKFPQNHIMSTDGETVRWTQRMTLQDGVLTFEIVNGTSQTWGAFGGQGYLCTTVLTDLPNLNGYSPTLSVENSGIGYAANRVQSLVLKSIRAVTSTGDVYEDNTIRTPYRLQ